MTIEGELRFNDFDNTTPANDYEYVMTDTALASGLASNIAYDYERREFKLRGEYRLSRRTRLHAGIDIKRMERNQQDRRSTTTCVS